MFNPWLARFRDVPALVSPELQGVFESCLHQTALIQARLDADKDSPKMRSADDDFWFADDDWRSALRPYTVKDGILHIPVKGVLLHDFPYAFGSWATGYLYIWKAIERGLADANVKGIALVVDSPGGMVAGNFELVDKVFAARGAKPIRAYANESAYSAAYSIASAADSIIVSKTGGVGSIGVVTAHVDVSAAMEKAGYKVTFIHFGEHKTDGNPYEALPEAVKARMQERINELGQVFVSTVARNRAMDEQAVRDTKALTFTANQAIANGLADSIGAFDDAVAAFAAEMSPNEEDETMTTQTPAFDQAAVDSARAAGVEQGKTEGARAERARIVAIISSDTGKERPKSALAAALKSSMSVEEADAFLADLPKESAQSAEGDKQSAGSSDFSNAMDKDKQPNLGGRDTDPPAMSRAERAFAASGRAKKPD